MAGPELKEFFLRFGLVPARYFHADWAMEHELSQFSILPFFISIFLHGGWIHFLINIWTLWIFGDNVEDEMGRGRYLVFFLLCGIVANTVHLLFHPHSRIPTIGASGAIAAVMGAYMWLYPRACIVVFVPVFFIPVFLEVPAFFYIGIWFMIQLFSGVASLGAKEISGGIAWWTHIGGFLTGIFLLRFFSGYRRHKHLPSFRRKKT